MQYLIGSNAVWWMQILPNVVCTLLPEPMVGMHWMKSKWEYNSPCVKYCILCERGERRERRVSVVREQEAVCRCEKSPSHILKPYAANE